MKFNTTVRSVLAMTVAVAGAFNAASASAQTRVDLDNDLWNTFNDTFVQDEKAFLSNAGQFEVDLNDLIYTGYGEDKALEVFFINEGAGYRNALSLGVAGGSSTLNPVFKDISSKDSVIAESNGALELGQGASFLPDDTKPELVLGTAIELTLNANGSSQYVYSTDDSKNVDGLQHVVGYNFNDGVDNWLILGFEDLYGELGATGVDAATGLNNQKSDRDFNDVVIALRGVSTKEAVPEPGMVIGLAGAAALGALRRRKSAK